jgi:secondary thiamine-phosphate synthase enzyme
MITQHILHVQTEGRGLVNITQQIEYLVTHATIETGLCHLFLHHTSASLIICENADQTVQKDLEAFMQRLVRDGDPLFQHTLEGPDDMSAHVRTVLTQSSLTIPITQHQLALGTWQGIFLWEHRYKGYQRKITVTLNQ